MTIHADWIAQFKEWTPAAFTPDWPTTSPPPGSGFIDGQIKLMGMPRPEGEDTLPSWQVFLGAQFVRPIQQLWAMGAHTVVLAFDDYEHVPSGKAITQAARRRNLPPFPFQYGQTLPVTPPTPWASAMSNRAFKARVQQLIVEEVPELLMTPSAPLKQEEEEGCTPFVPSAASPYHLIVDWRGADAIEFCYSFDPDGTPHYENRAMPRALIGEADIKFAHWAAILPKPLAVHATDGDFIPIGLLLPGTPDVSIYRFECGGGHGKKKKPTKPIIIADENTQPPPPLQSPKRTREEEDDGQQQDEPSLASSGNALTPSRYEWLHIPTLHSALTLLVGEDLSPLIVLVALTGTDYSRTLPTIGPKTIIARTGLQSALRLARKSLFLPKTDQAAVTPDTLPPPTVRLLDPPSAMDSLVCCLYTDAYSRHCSKRCPRTYSDLLAILRRPTCALAERTRARLPSQSQVLTTLRNANFLLLYWRNHAPNSLSGAFGFRSHPDTGAVEWDDRDGPDMAE